MATYICDTMCNMRNTLLLGQEVILIIKYIAQVISQVGRPCLYNASLNLNIFTLFTNDNKSCLQYLDYKATAKY